MLFCLVAPLVLLRVADQTNLECRYFMLFDTPAPEPSGEISADISCLPSCQGTCANHSASKIRTRETPHGVAAATALVPTSNSKSLSSIKTYTSYQTHCRRQNNANAKRPRISVTRVPTKIVARAQKIMEPRLGFIHQLNTLVQQMHTPCAIQGLCCIPSSPVPPYKQQQDFPRISQLNNRKNRNATKFL